MDARVWEIITEAFGKVLIAGIQVTIPMTILSLSLIKLNSMSAFLIEANKILIPFIINFIFRNILIII